MDVYSTMHVEISVKENICVGQLRIYKKVRHLNSIIRIIQQLCVDDLA